MFSRETHLAIRKQRKPTKLTPIGVCVCVCVCVCVSMGVILFQNVSQTFTFSEISIPVLISIIANKYNIVWPAKPGIEI